MEKEEKYTPRKLTYQVYQKGEYTNYILVNLAIKERFGLSTNEAMVYGWLFRETNTYHRGGFSGVKDQHIAEELGLTRQTVNAVEHSLVEKELIIIENPGKRTKKTAKSKMIYLTDKPYLNSSNSVANIETEEFENMKKEIELLRLQIEEQKKIIQNQNQHHVRDYSQFVEILFVRNIIEDTPDNRKQATYRLGYLYADFYESYTNASLKMDKHLRQIQKAIKKKKPEDIISYLERCMYNYQYALAKSNPKKNTKKD